MPGRSALRRLFLFAVLAFGVACMHTLGHQGLTGHAGTAMPAHGMAATDMPIAAAVAPALGAPDESPTPGSPADPLAVCLAILSLALLVVLSLLLVGRKRPLWLLQSLVAPGGSAGRDPPAPRPIGLALAAVSVMRT